MQSITDFQVLNDKFDKINQEFLLVKRLHASNRSKSVWSYDCSRFTRCIPHIQISIVFTGVMWNNTFLCSTTYLYLRLGMGLSVSPATSWQFIDKVFENIPNRARYKIIMDDAMIFSVREQYFEDLANFFYALIKFGLKISPTDVHLKWHFNIHETYNHVEKNGKP